MTTRRGFLRQSAAAAASASLGLTLAQFVSACNDASERRLASAPFKTLAAEEATEFEAIAICIVPTTDTPGARESGAIYFIDNVLGGGRADMLDSMRAGLASVQSRVRSANPGVERFSVLDEAGQIEILTQTETSDPEFFDNIRLLTLAGLLANPEYGGNRDNVGWQLIGFDNRHAWQSPFGYYDEILQTDLAVKRDAESNHG